MLINYNNIFIVGDFNYCTIDWNLRYRVGQKENILVFRVLTNRGFLPWSVELCFVFV